MSIGEDKVLRIVEPHKSRLWECVSGAYQTYRERYPHKTIHRRATRASIVNDEILARVIEAFDDVPDCRFDMDRTRNLRFLIIGEQIMLWFKKVGLLRRPAMYLTSHARKLLSTGQIEMFPRMDIIMVGYCLNNEETKIQRLSFSPPFLIRPTWYFDIEDQGGSDIQQMPAASGPGPRPMPSPATKLVVIRGYKQQKLIGD